MGLFEQLQAYIDANTPRNTRKPVNAGTVIDQGLLGGRIGQVPQRAQEMYQGLLGAPAELAALGSPAMRSQVDQAMTKPQPIDKDKAMQMAMDTLQTTTPVGGLVSMVSKLDGPAMSVADDAGGLLKTSRPRAQVEADINALEKRVKAEMEARTGRPEPKVPDITEWTSDQMAELHSLKAELPTSSAERQAAIDRVQARIADRKNGLLPTASAQNTDSAGVKVFRAGNPKGMTADKGGPTFYATAKDGAVPYAHGDASKVWEETISPKNVFDTRNIEHRKIYDQFLKDGGHPYGYGKTARPFWTSEYELKRWLDKTGQDFDAIMFDENTGIPSYAVYGSPNGKPK